MTTKTPIEMAIETAIEALTANKQWLEQLHNRFKEDWPSLDVQTGIHLNQTEDAIAALQQLSPQASGESHAHPASMKQHAAPADEREGGLLPCPFCGGEPAKYGYSVGCRQCGASVVADVSDLKKPTYKEGQPKANKLWNTRPAIDWEGMKKSIKAYPKCQSIEDSIALKSCLDETYALMQENNNSTAWNAAIDHVRSVIEGGKK